MKWVSDERKPELDYQHGNIFTSKEVLLDLGDSYIVSRWCRHILHNTNYWDSIEDDEIVEGWAYIPERVK